MHRQFIIIVAFMLPVLSFAQGPEYALSRVGSTLSVSEREYFQLFRNLDDFAQATFQQLSNGGLRIDVRLRDEAHVVLKLDSLEHVLFDLWLRRYEHLSFSGDTVMQAMLRAVGSARASEKLRAFSRLHANGIIDIEMHRFEEPLQPLIVTTDGDTLRRALLAVTEAAVFVWDAGHVYDAASVGAHLRRIPADSIMLLEAPVTSSFGPAFLAGMFTSWAAMLHLVSREATGNEKEHFPVFATAVALPIPAAIPGLLLGGLASIPSLTRKYSIVEDSLAVKRAIPALIPRTMFGTNVPPEFHSRGIAGEVGMKVYGDSDTHPYDYLARRTDMSAWMLGVESLIHVYNVHARPVSAHIGLSLSRDIPLLRLSTNRNGWYTALRPRISAGTFIGAECALLLANPQSVSFLAGLAYTHVYEELGRSYEGHLIQHSWTSSYERESVLQESFAIVGLSIPTSYGAWEFQYRRVLQSALHTKVRWFNYENDYYEEQVFGIKGFGGMSMIMNVRL
jgi:hypothetical protein